MRHAKRRIVTLFRSIQVGLVEKFGMWRHFADTQRIDKTKMHPVAFAGRAISLCKGTGIEIGALHRRLPLEANVLYLDLQNTDSLREKYRQDERVSEISQVHLIANGSKYPFIDTGALDFVASSHVLEHTVNPPRQIQEWLRILRKGGVLYMIVPDMRFSFDRRRNLTPLSHFIEEFECDMETISIEHYRDYLVNTNGEEGTINNLSEENIIKCHAKQESIHVHTFTSDSLWKLLAHFAAPLSFEVIYFDSRQLDIHAALKKIT